MKKVSTILVLIVVMAALVVAFVACDDTPSEEIDAVQGWSANTVWLDSPLVEFITGYGSSTGVLSFVDEEYWRIDVGGGAAELGDNANWCNGRYWFEGENGEQGTPGVDPLHMVLFDYDTYVDETGNAGTDAKDTYNPENIALVEPENDTPVNKNVEVVYLPDESGIYTVRARGIGQFGILAGNDAEIATMTFKFYPPQDGSLGLDGVPAPPPEAPDGLGLPATISIIVCVIVVVIAAIVVTVVLVKKNKKKKAALAASQEDVIETEVSTEDGGDTEQ